MTEESRALIFILVLSATFFSFAHRPACSLTETGYFQRRRNIWFGLTLAAFLAHNFWLYTLVATLILIYANRRESNPSSLFFFNLFVLPVAYISIPGMGIMNFLIQFSHARMLELLILLPAFVSLLRQGNTPSFGRTGSDRAFIAYILLSIILHQRNTSLTDNLRQTFYLYIDVFLPYFVISRSVRNMQAFRDSLLSLVLAIMLLALFALFEFFKNWLLYDAVTLELGLNRGVAVYMKREGLLRVLVTAGQPIPLGYLMVAGMGLYLFLQRSIQQTLVRWVGMILLAAGLIAPLSRGPWIGAAVLIVIFIATGRYALRRLMILAIVAIFALPVVSMLPGGAKVINLLPFVGSTDKENVDYRKDLITNSIIVIKRNLWFGSVDYLNTPELESMRQGQGQGDIDIVNTYIGVSLETGIIGLGLFVSFFALTLSGIYRSMHSIPDRDSEEHLLGRVLLATLLAILTIIFTVSSITVIPIVYWSVAGLGVAYTRMVRSTATSRSPTRLIGAY
jgi:hypothetical protein